MRLIRLSAVAHDAADTIDADAARDLHGVKVDSVGGVIRRPTLASCCVYTPRPTRSLRP